ncbi:hypothetical protein KFE25_008135 [Diacronema lutheri]|uniref:Cation efflux protein transmembrane domain-containing protein n=1 Tax=Diacronema lutheri TaxID=2081491 RepID=A0A8J5XN91_DIALT|nr:hypothetical protein KFE25_008135 [Diacronema lutheri]
MGWRAFLADDPAAREAPHKRMALSRNERTLVLTLLLFASITSAQFVGAAFARSLSLLVDAASMLVDVMTYAANLWAECAAGRGARHAELVELGVSGFSLCTLWVIMIISVSQAAAALRMARGASGAEAGHGDDAVDGRIVLGFAAVGIVIDVIVLHSFAQGHAHGGDTREAHDEALGMADAANAAMPRLPEARRTAAPARNCGAPAEERAHSEMAARGRVLHCCGSMRGQQLNMSSALAHVLADLFRSLTTLVESAAILSHGMDGRFADSVAAICVAVAIALSSAGTTSRWIARAALLCQARCVRQPVLGQRTPMAADDVTVSQRYSAPTLTAAGLLTKTQSV